MNKFTRFLIFLSFLLVFLVPAWAQDLSDIIIVGFEADQLNSQQIRADSDGEIIWQKPIPLIHFGADMHRFGSRNQSEDALYISSYNVADQIDGKNRLLKLDANGDVVWDIPFSASPIYLQANPVDGGVYALERLPGSKLHKIDSDGNIVWTLTSFVAGGISVDPTSGGVFVAQPPNVVKLAADGSVIWTRPIPQDSFGGPWQVDANPIDGGVYVGYSQYNRHTQLFDGDGNLMWTKQAYPANWNYGRSVSPLDGSLFIGSGWPGRIARIATDGTVLFNIPSNEAYLPYLSAAIDEVAAYTGDYSQHGVTKHAYDGSVIWQKLYGPPSWVGRYQVMHVYTGVPAVDSDGDGVPDDEDICQGWDDLLDVDDDGIPDGCDDCPLDLNNDSDGDGSCDSADLCLGNDTTGDSDSDGLCNDIDPCVGSSNSDGDSDGVCDEGDLCFGDDASGNTDGDGVCDNLDACDGDDATGDTDNDLFCDDLDVCPLDVENDADGDGICEVEDNCDVIPNANQSDLDGNNVGDLCDDDIDGDGVLNNVDNCVFDVNSDQTDFDNDGAGDICDDDADGDGVVDAGDACVPTPVGEVVEASGCSIGEICPCENNWKNHGAYVRCVAHTSEDFVEEGFISEAEKDAIVSAAGQSECGHKK